MQLIGCISTAGANALRFIPSKLQRFVVRKRACKGGRICIAASVSVLYSTAYEVFVYTLYTPHGGGYIDVSTPQHWLWVYAHRKVLQFCCNTGTTYVLCYLTQNQSRECQKRALQHFFRFCANLAELWVFHVRFCFLPCAWSLSLHGRISFYLSAICCLRVITYQ